MTDHKTFQDRFAHLPMSRLIAGEAGLVEQLRAIKTMLMAARTDAAEAADNAPAVDRADVEATWLQASIDQAVRQLVDLIAIVDAGGE